MPNSGVGSTFRTGLALAVGLLIGNVLAMPFISNRTFLENLGVGITAALFAVVAYSTVAIVRNRTDAK